MGLQSDLTAIKSIQDGVKNNKVTRFAYTQQAYTENDADGHTDYVYSRENNIPTDSISVMEVNQTVVDKGFRARASSLTRMLLNHLFGRISYNLNKINDLFNDLLVKIMANMGVANGLATLDATGRIPYSMLPEDAMEYQGEWNAQTNTPTLADGTGTKGDTYSVSVAGTQTFGGESITFFVGDRVVYNGSVWQRFSAGNVQSVCEIQPDETTGNVDLSKQADITKIFNMSFLNKLFNNACVWNLISNIDCTTFAYGNGIFIAGSIFNANNGIFCSADGKTWSNSYTFNSSVQLSSSDYTESLIFANGLFLMATYNQGIWWSADGYTWTQGKSLSASVCIHYVNNLFIADTATATFWSTDGKTWTDGSVTKNYLFTDIIYNGEIWVAGGGRGQWSNDGKTWYPSNLNVNCTLNYIEYAEDLDIWVGCAYTSISSLAGLYWSDDGKTWVRSAITYTYMQFVHYANGVFIAGSNQVNHCLFKSTDGKTWTNVKSDLVTSYHALTNINNLWLVGTQDQGVWYSEDNGDTWKQGIGTEEAGINWRINSIIYSNGIYIALGTRYGSVIGLWISIDGKTWQKAEAYGAIVLFRMVLWARGVWLTGGDAGGNTRQSYVSGILDVNILE